MNRARIMPLPVKSIGNQLQSQRPLTALKLCDTQYTAAHSSQPRNAAHMYRHTFQFFSHLTPKCSSSQNENKTSILFATFSAETLAVAFVLSVRGLYKKAVLSQRWACDVPYQYPESFLRLPDYVYEYFSQILMRFCSDRLYECA